MAQISSDQSGNRKANGQRDMGGKVAEVKQLYAQNKERQHHRHKRKSEGRLSRLDIIG